LQEISPETKVLFCSGYTEDAASLNGAPGSVATFLPKPYSVMALAKRVREVLDS
jgi:two-component system cell cycle sensor histidine kinase/response regulator CckA